MSKLIVTKAEFEEMAEERLVEAKVLLDLGKWNGAYYLAGYAVELALKACIIKILMATDAFPYKEFSKNCYTHDVKKLVELAKLDGSRKAAMNGDPDLLANRAIAIAWSEEKRYHKIDEIESETLYTAISDDTHGVLPWIKTHWVNEQLDSGRQFIEQLVADGIDVEVAFWTKLADEGGWYLCIASRLLDEKGPAAAYRLVHSILRRMPDISIEPLEIRLVRLDDSLTEGAIEVIKPKVADGPFAVRNPKPYRGITRFGGSTLGGIGVDGAFIYPPSQNRWGGLSWGEWHVLLS